MTKGSKVAVLSAATVLLIVLMFCAGEAYLRLVQWFRAGVPLLEGTGRSMANLSPITIDEVLGWRATGHYRSRVTERTAGGREYTVSRSQDGNGFRMFGDARSQKPKVLVIGDSFTQAPQVSDDKTYYAILREKLNTEVFAYGVGGYGTLQEYMILDQYLDLIKPHLILWQYGANDFINNDPVLEMASRDNNNGMRRPYWIDGSIVSVLPKDSWERTRDFANHYSRFLYFIIGRLDRLHALYAAETVETEIERQGLNHQGFVRSMQVTDDLMGRVRSRVGTIPIVAFSSDTYQPFTDAFRRISSHHGIQFLDDVAVSVEIARDRGEDVLASDKEHWNEEGHRIAGEVIARHLQEVLMRMSGDISTRERAEASGGHAIQKNGPAILKNH